MSGPRPQRRLSIAPLEHAAALDDGERTVTVRRLARLCRMAEQSIYRARRDGLTVSAADRAAVALGVHPTAIWPDFDAVDDDEHETPRRWTWRQARADAQVAAWQLRLECATVTPRWYERAACAGCPDLMAASGDPDAAVAVCSTCPVRLACLGAARVEEEGAGLAYGVRGGLTGPQRRDVYRRLRRRRDAAVRAAKDSTETVAAPVYIHSGACQ